MTEIARTPSKKATLRRRVVADLSQEILNSSESKDYLLASEHQLCQRFFASRVTIRLALADLENKGLIYRWQGKGTFARGNSTRVHRSLGILIHSTEALKHPGLGDMRGVLTAITPLRASLALITTYTVDWQLELAGHVAGVIVLRQDLPSGEVDVFKERNLPFLHIRESQLASPNRDS